MSVGVSGIASDDIISVRVACDWASEASFGCSSAGGSSNVGLGLTLLCSLASNLRSIFITAVFLWELFFFFLSLNKYAISHTNKCACSSHLHFNPPKVVIFWVFASEVHVAPPELQLLQ